MQIIFVAVLWCGLLVSTAASADEPARKFRAGSMSTDRVAADIKLLEKLLTKSSLARAVNVADSGTKPDPQNDAALYFEKAKKAHKEGNKELAAEYIKKAKEAMFSAARKSIAVDADNSKLKRDYQKRVRNVRALLGAFKRVSEEKQPLNKTDAVEQQVLEQLAKADSQTSGGKFTDAKHTVDAAFNLIMQKTIGLRDGDTLVRELNFANKEEEYKYELDRNHTHQMLVNILLKEKMSVASIAKKVNSNMTESEKYRTKADAMAKKGNYEAAIKNLEDSTKFIIRAIRAAGIYIPG